MHNAKSPHEGMVQMVNGSWRPQSLRESVGLSVVRRLDPKRGVKAQDILQKENLRRMADKHFKGGGCEKCKTMSPSVGLYRCFKPDGFGGCANRKEAGK